MERGKGAAVRAAPARSPRIQELVGRFEERPSSPRAPQVTPAPPSASGRARRDGGTQENQSRTAAKRAAGVKGAERADGLPMSSSGPITTLGGAHESAAATGVTSSRRAPPTSQPRRTQRQGADGTGTTSSSVSPVPASAVFSRGAPALHLPALDQYLARPELFHAPHFSDPRAIATTEESVLYGWAAQSVLPEKEGSSAVHRRKGKRRRRWEIAGGQICGCAEKEAVRRKTAKADGQVAESIELRKMVSLSSTLAADASVSKEQYEDSVADKRPLLSNLPSYDSAQTESTGVASQLSSASHPLTRLDMFPPLMLLKASSLDELKSNAVGPRAPPGGILASLPPLQSLLGTLTDLVIGVEGSSFAAGIIRLETLRDFIQLLQNNLSWTSAVPSTSSNTGWSNSARTFFFHTLPSILALDFVSLLGRAEIFMVLWMISGGLMLWRFWVITRSYDHNRFVDGFDSRPSAYTSPARGTKAAYILLVFGLTTAYIPLTKLAIDTLVWNSDFWVINPLAGSSGVQDLPKDLPALGDTDHYRGPLDFCYTTTMRKDKFNFAWLLIPMAVLTILLYTIWMPIRMVQVLRRLVPHVSEYNELGLKRTPEEMDLEYQRLLGKDKSPLNFMINGYKRRWAFYKPIYILCFKLTNVLIISVLTRNNCLWRFQHMKSMLLVQQSVLIGLMSVLLVVHIIIKPFVDAISNRSEMVSRIGYVLTALLGLLVALNVDGSTVYRSTILYIVQGCSYSMNFYFTLAGTGFFEHAVKRAQQRLDFSLDIFSPALHMEKHIRRRIWEETFSTILLAAPSYRMPENQVVAFSTSDDDKWPPYLLKFQNTAAERHVENIKLLRELGSHAYRDYVELERGHVAARWQAVMHTIQSNFTGPDTYWRPIRPPHPVGVSSFFGKAFAIPFPPTVIMRYDQGDVRTEQLTTLEELEAFVAQNEHHAIQQARRLRLALRSLADQRVYCPYVRTEEMYQNTRMFGRRPKRHNYSVAVPVTYLDGVLRIKFRDPSPPPGAYNFSSGFEVSIEYEDGLREDADGSSRVREPVVVTGSAAFELFDDFRPSNGLAKLLHDNQVLVKSRLPVLDKLMKAYRAKYLDEARRKRSVMSYAFVVDIFSNHRLRRHELQQAFERSSCCEAVRRLPQRYRASITALYERLEAVHRSEVHQWWWLFWDDLWRRNYRDMAALRKHRTHFCPSFPTSIAYQPLPRRDLELFLAKYGLWHSGGKKGFIHAGTLNSIYFYLDELVFGHAEDSTVRARAIRLGVGSNLDGVGVQEHGLDSLEVMGGGGRPGMAVRGPGPGGLGVATGTGGGTDYERSDIVDRRAKRWEVLMSGRGTLSWRARVWNAALGWLNLHPLKIDGRRQGLFLYVVLREGRYELPGEEGLRSGAGRGGPREDDGEEEDEEGSRTL